MIMWNWKNLPAVRVIPAPVPAANLPQQSAMTKPAQTMQPAVVQSHKPKAEDVQ